MSTWTCDIRLAALVAANLSQGTFVFVHIVTMPRSKVTNEMDVGCLAVVYRVEIIVAVDWVEVGVVCELLLRDSRMVL